MKNSMACVVQQICSKFSKFEILHSLEFFVVTRVSNTLIDNFYILSK